MEKHKIEKRIFKIRRNGILFGLSIIFGGFLVLYTGYNHVGPVTPAASWLIIFIGIFIVIYSATRKLNRKNLIALHKANHKICVQCGEIYATVENESKCKSCDCKLEKVEGFFERHPNCTKQKGDR